MKQLFLVLYVMLATSCMSVAYKIPDNTPFAFLVITTWGDMLTNTGFVRYIGDMQGYRCSSEPNQGLAILHNKSIINRYADGGKYLDSVELKVPANGDEFRFNAPTPLPSPDYDAWVGEWTVMGCQPHVSFVPKPGVTYLAIHQQTSSSCEIKISRFDDKGNQIPEETEKHWPPCYDTMSTDSIFEADIKGRYAHDTGRSDTNPTISAKVKRYNPE